MRGFAIGLGALALTACNFSFSTDEIGVENAIKENLSSRGEVLEVDMTRSDDDHMTGFARVRGQQGRESRLNCTAERQAAGATNFTWRCTQVLDAALIDETEAAIRNTLQSQATVLDVQLSRRDDDHMTGFAMVRDSNGNEGRMECAADRQTDGTFNWRCDPPGQSGGEASADAAGGDKDPAAGGGDKPAE